MLSSDLDPSTESNLQVCLGRTEIVGREVIFYSQFICSRWVAQREQGVGGDNQRGHEEESSKREIKTPR